ncbi:MAG: APC family permease [Eubacteriales bacterium]|nr:APC family permease [Eubacteriales bacterium]MDD4583320.1 APC family permease [Eubacteriales bacterium]
MLEQNNVTRLDGVAGLKKHRMRPTGIAFMLYCLVAAGAFGIEEMIPISGPGLTLTMLIVFPIIWALPICLTVSELSAFMPAEGGIYVWVKEALGEFWGFLMGWWGTISIYLSNAVYVVLIVGYAQKFIPMTDMQAVVVKVGIVLIFTVINLLGLKEVSAVSTILSIIILIAFAGIAVVGFANWNFNPFIPFTPEGQPVIESLGGSICIVIWMYCGYECVSNMAGEIENPEVIPKGFMIAMPLIALSYVLPTMAGIASIGQWESWGTEGEAVVGYMDVFIQNLGAVWGVVFLAVAIISQCAIFNAYIAAGSRGFFVLADDKLCPKFLVKVSQKRGVPYLAILLLSATTMVMMNFDFSTLLTFLMPLAIMVYVILAIALLVLRKKYPVEERGNVYYIKGNKWVIRLIAAAPFVIGIIGLLVNGTEYFLLGFVSIGSGVVAYIIFKLMYGGLYKLDPEKYPINPKTRFALGDVTRFGAYLLTFGAYAFVGSFFLVWYEGDWGAEYYLEMYETGLASNFDLMIDIARYGGLIALIIGIALFFLGRKYDK